ncbi:hypothetical protein VTO42DRAFT_4090 [Malbranchea cinnamomea]
MVPSSVETLVHIYAPSGARDDANYRAHARACLEFQPATRLRLSSSDLGDVEAGDGDGDEITREAPPGETTLGGQFDDSVFDEDTQQTASLDSRGENASLGAPLQRPSCLEFPPSSVPAPPPSSARIEISLLSSQDSQSQNIPSPPPPPPPPVAADAAAVATAPPHSESGPLDDDSVPFETPPSTVPDSQPVFTPNADIEKDNSPGNGRIRVLWARESQLASSQELQSPSAKRPRLASDQPRASPGLFLDADPSPVPPAPPARPDGTDVETAAEPEAADAADAGRQSTYVAAALSRRPVEIRPPPPVPSSTADFTTHITPTLHMLAEKMNLTRVFRPARQERPLRALERGHWFVRLPILRAAASDAADRSSTTTTKNAPSPRSAPWTDSVFDQFWNYLATFIGKEGRAGWGVWCLCEAEAGALPGKPSAADREVPGDDPADLYLVVKVYTWGEIAAHIYLLLYLASERRIKLVPGVEWRDGKEDPIIQMP